ncbi:MAG: DUF3833 domain-containing protein [Gammaproteobacteria bacterium]
MTGCAAIPVEYYSAESPRFDPLVYFDGDIEAWGIVSDWRGRVTRRFTAKIDAKTADNKITLFEKFKFSDGENSTRTWDIKLAPNGLIQAQADDIVGSATGKISGNAMRLQYRIDLPVDGKIYRVQFNDMLWQIDNDVLFNRAAIKKFGLKVAEVVLFMKKAAPSNDTIAHSAVTQSDRDRVANYQTPGAAVTFERKPRLDIQD